MSSMVGNLRNPPPEHGCYDQDPVANGYHCVGLQATIVVRRDDRWGVCEKGRLRGEATDAEDDVTDQAPVGKLVSHIST